VLQYLSLFDKMVPSLELGVIHSFLTCGFPRLWNWSHDFTYVSISFNMPFQLYFSFTLLYVALTPKCAEVGWSCIIYITASHSYLLITFNSLSFFLRYSVPLLISYFSVNFPSLTSFFILLYSSSFIF